MNRPVSSQTTAVKSLVAEDTSQSRPMDQKTLEGIRALENEGASDLLNERGGIYLNESPKLLQDLKEAIIGTDAAALQKSSTQLEIHQWAHGALSLAALCKELETMGRVNRMEGVAAVWSKTAKEYDKMLAALKMECQEE